VTLPLWVRSSDRASDTHRTIRQRTGPGTPSLEPKARRSPRKGCSPTPDAQPPRCLLNRNRRKVGATEKTEGKGDDD
jgi:hypothetical protein